MLLTMGVCTQNMSSLEYVNKITLLHQDGISSYFMRKMHGQTTLKNHPLGSYHWGALQSLLLPLRASPFAWIFCIEQDMMTLVSAVLYQCWQQQNTTMTLATTPCPVLTIK